MCVLAFDTASLQCAVAVLKPDGAAVSLAEPTLRGQPERLLQMIRQAMEQADCAYDNLTRIVVTTGPGSFTGLRVGIAAAKGLGLALAIPVVGISSFAAFETILPANNPPHAVIIESRRAELYWRLGHAQPQIGTIQEIARQLPEGAIVLGDAAHRLADPARLFNLRDQQPGPDVVELAKLGSRLDPALHPANPVYVRPPDAMPRVP